MLPSSGPAPGLTAISTVSTVLPVIALLGPLLVVGVIALALSRPVPQASRSEPRPSLFKVPFAASAARVWALTRSATMPADYRSLFNPRALEAAAAGATPVLWLAALVALAIAVTR